MPEKKKISKLMLSKLRWKMSSGVPHPWLDARMPAATHKHSRWVDPDLCCWFLQIGPMQFDVKFCSTSHCAKRDKAPESRAKHYRGREQGVTKWELEQCKGVTRAASAKGGRCDWSSQCKGVTRETPLICLYPMIAHNTKAYIDFNSFQPSRLKVVIL